MADIKTCAVEFVSAIKKYKNILFYIKGSPDPDAIASSFALTIVCEAIGVKAAIEASNALSLPQNKAFVKQLGIPLKITEEPVKPEKFDAYAVLDHQSAFVDGLTGRIPCALHIDHHAKGEEEAQADFRYISKTAGSTCTIIALLIRELADEPITISQTIATALLFGIQTDTDKYSRATEQDYEAIEILAPIANDALLNRLSVVPMSPAVTKGLNIAAGSGITYKDWFVAGVGYINEADRDSIAIIADFLLRRTQASVVAVYAIVRRKRRPKLTLDVSLRSDNSSIDLNGIIKNITTNGGARKYKGAFQIDLDFFSFYDDAPMLWNTVSAAVIDAIKRQRDTKVGGGLKSLFKRIINRN